MTTPLLSVWTDHEDTVVAASAEDAVAVMKEVLGGAEYYDGDVDDWSARPDTDTLVIRDENEPENEGCITKTCAEWVAHNGRGHLCSVNY